MPNLWIWMTIFVVTTVSAFPNANRTSRNTYTLVTRAGWSARATTWNTRLSTPVSLVVIHHTDTPSCTTRTACVARVQSIQNHHMDENRWDDIGYHFLVGGDGTAYEGRGWMRQGAHALGWNAQSVGIALIGNFVSANPPARQLNAVQHLIDAGVRSGFIARNYRLIGHRQVSDTECPGAALFRTIQGWRNFSWNP